MDIIIQRYLFDEALFHWLISAGCYLINSHFASLCLLVRLYSDLCSGLGGFGGWFFPSVPVLIGFPTKD
jgi:hypothetical protein